MGKVSLLDCTLRDGGYVNDWNFGHDNLVSIFERVVDAGTDIIEIGFLDDRRPFDMNRSIMPDTDCVEKIYGNLDRKNTKVFGMIDYGTCSLEHIRPCSESWLDGIRVIFKKHLRVEALAFCAELKKLGYIVFAQLVSVTSYSDEELLDLVRLANEVKPDAVSMVDTYGLMHQNNLDHFLGILDSHLDTSIAIGYHGHNNFQMGYANCITMLAHRTDRPLLVDGSLYGMGKSAGNAPIELIAMHMNHQYGKNYHISQYLEAIDANIMEFYTPATWGYNLFFYLAASNDCHPNYVKQLMNKKTLSIRQVNELLGRLQGEKKLLYDKEYMEQLYLEYQDKNINDAEDAERLKETLAGRSILIVGPGKTMQTERDRLQKFTQEEKPFVIAINYVPEVIRPDCIFLTNTRRYIQVATALSDGKYTTIATSNVTSTGKPFDYVLNISDLLDRGSRFIDNSLMMLLKTMMRIGVKMVTLAGFDGYSGTDQNYFDEGKEYDFAREQAEYLNAYMSAFLKNNQQLLRANFLTTTKYQTGYSKKYDLVVFDVDGTLLDTSEGVLSGVRYTIEHFGYAPLTQTQLRKFIGPPIQNSFADAYGLKGDVLQEVATVFRTEYKEHGLLKAVPYDGIYEVFEGLRERNIISAIATYKREDYALTLLDHFHFDQYTKIMHGADHENRLKKSDIIRMCIEESGVKDLSRVLMIGDTDNDAAGAKAMGVDFLAVSFGFGYRKGERVSDYPSIGTADTAYDILKIIDAGECEDKE